MELEYAFFARYVEPALDGTLTVVGLDLGRVIAEQFPATLPRSTVVVKLKSPAPDVIRFRFQMVGPTGVMVLQSGTEWHEAIARKDDHSGASEGARLVLNLPPLGIPAAGTYVFTLTMQGGPEVSLPLKVTGVPEMSS